MPPQPPNVMAFDFGTRNIGVAVANPQAYSVGAQARELPNIKARDGIPDWDAVGKLLQAEKVGTILVGLPLDADDEPMEITLRARKFGRRLEARFQLPLHFVDERLTTKAAKTEARERGLLRGDGHMLVDSIAARLILETYLAEL